MGGDDGLISIFLKTTAESLEHCLVHDITKSPMKLAHMFWKLQPDSAIFYDAAFRRFDKVTYKVKDSACSGWVIDDATLIQALATYKLTDEGKAADSNVSFTVSGFYCRYFGYTLAVLLTGSTGRGASSLRSTSTI